MPAPAPDARPLGDEDASILALESDTVAGHICKVILLDGELDVGALRASIRARLPRARELSMRLGHGSDVDGPEPGNRDSFFCLDLPLSTGDPIARLSSIQRATRVRKQGHDAQHLDALMHELGRVPRLAQFADRALSHPRSFALNVSNVPGPQGRVSVLGIPVLTLFSLAEIYERHALRVSVVSLTGSLTFGLAADPTLVTDVDGLANGIRDEARELSDRLRLV